MAEWPLSAPAYIRLDLFPCNVTLTDETKPYTDRARVIITNADFYVFVDGTPEIACDYSGAVFDATGDAREGFRVTLEDESVFTLRRSGNCGCGSRLRGWSPFPGTPYRRF